MKAIFQTRQFKKDFKRIKKQDKDLSRACPKSHKSLLYLSFPGVKKKV